MLLQEIEQMLREKFPHLAIEPEFEDESRNIILLKGDCRTWRELIDVGHAVAAVQGVGNVVSDMTVEGKEIPKKDYSPYIEKGLEIGVIDDVDVLVVGLGITGCGITRELSRYDLNIMAIDMGEDVATGATKANNGGCHSAIQVSPDSVKGRMCVRGNQLYDKWAEELNFDFLRCGTMWYAEKEEDLFNDDPYNIVNLFATAVANHDKGPRLVDKEGAYEIEPKLKEYGIEPFAAVWSPTQCKTHPYKTCVALAENAAANGVKFMFNCGVGQVVTENGKIKEVITERGIIRTKYLINAAGIYSDEISEMAGDRCFMCHNRRGTLAVFDKSKPPKFPTETVLYESKPQFTRDSESKGGGMDLTCSGNILIGPSAVEIPDKENTETTEIDLEYCMSKNQNDEVTEKDIIRIFAGARPADLSEDFVIELSPKVDGLINAGAIQSPGVGSSPAIAEYVIQLLKSDFDSKGVELKEKGNFNPIREKPVVFNELSREEQDALIAKNPAYGRIVCRCEGITEGEILDAIRSPIVPTSVDAIKRRTRAGMGRCQGGFCQSRVIEILARELGEEWVEINLNRPGTKILKMKNRQEAQSCSK